MSGQSTQKKALLVRVAIVIVLVAAVAGVLYAKHTRVADAGAKAASRCPCSSHKPVTPGQ
jgi:uncharacterized membrane protein